PHLEHNALTLLLLQIGVIVALSRALGWLMKPLGQPLVIAEVTAGILLGPSLLGWVAPEAMAFLFPPASLPGLKLLSQVGLVLFMFLIGLEVDWSQLKGRGKSSVVISHASIVVPFILGSALAFAMRDAYSSAAVPFLSFVLFMGVAMSITAFPVLARILSERQLLGSRVGAMAIACAAVDDVTAWCLLAAVVAVSRFHGLASVVWTLGLSLAFIALLLLVVRPVLRRYSQRRSGAPTPSAIAVTLLFLLACSGATELIGIHALFGAFLFGVAMPKDNGFAAALAERLETVAVVLLLPLFFAFSGLRTQLGLLSDPADWGVTLAIIALATLGKFGGSTVAARLTGVPWREASAVGVLMNTRGLVELVVLNIGFDLGVINSTVFTMLVVMALVTTFATSPIIRRIYSDRELARERIDGEVPHERKGLLICVDDPQSGPGLALVTASLREASGDAEATALHLYPSTDRPSVELMHQQLAPDDGPLGPLLERAKALNQRVRPLTFVSSETAEDISRTAEAKQASLVLMAAHQLPWVRSPKTVLAVASRSASPVAVLVDRGLERVEKVVIALCGDVHDGAAFVLARHLGSIRARPVRLGDPAADLGDADLVLVGASRNAARLGALLEKSRASVLWVHPARSASMASAALALLESAPTAG
ncbi:MAG: cation:proton antiporter, partial [Myxococcaceae bacterium]|nr:cation:proton antiporter [Myxococcaceae bacterium]